jgi:voltage-gated potassium channel Kch
MDDEISDLQREYSEIRKRYALVFLTTMVLIGGGSVIYHHLMQLTWINAVYFTTVTLATVGYGDIVPKTDATKIFTIFYIFVGVGTIATFASLLVRQAGLRRELRRAKRRKKAIA